MRLHQAAASHSLYTAGHPSPSKRELTMNKMNFGDRLAVFANLGVILGILLLVYELNQTRDFARTEFIAGNLRAFQEIEREMINPDVAAVWAKAAVDPGSLSNSEIRVMDAYLISMYNFWDQQLALEQAGFLVPGQAQRELNVDVSYFFGSTFARAWWEELKSSHKDENREIDARIDKALEGTDPLANRKYLERMQQRLQEQIAAGEEPPGNRQ